MVAHVVARRVCNLWFFSLESNELALYTFLGFDASVCTAVGSYCFGEFITWRLFYLHFRERQKNRHIRSSIKCDSYFNFWRSNIRISSLFIGIVAYNWLNWIAFSLFGGYFFRLFPSQHEILFMFPLLFLIFVRFSGFLLFSSHVLVVYAPFFCHYFNCIECIQPL